jgi:hypothetical protein
VWAMSDMIFNQDVQYYIDRLHKDLEYYRKYKSNTTDKCERCETGTRISMVLDVIRELETIILQKSFALLIPTLPT